MVFTVTPTLADQRWGADVWSRFDWYRNPVRIGVDAKHPNGQNPLYLYRHGGGGTVGRYDDYRSSASGDVFYFLHWLHGENTGAQPTLPWDVISFSSAQGTFFSSAGGVGFAHSRSVYFPEAIRDYQRAIASIKHLSIDLGFNPDRIITGGESHGATLGALGQLGPTVRGRGGRTIWTEGLERPMTHDSRVRGVLFDKGQVDIRKFSGVDYFSYLLVPGWLGTRRDSSVGFDAVPAKTREAFSIRAYFERGEIATYPSGGFYVSYPSPVGNHVHPFINGHDSAQYADLATAITNAGLPFHGHLRAPLSLVNSDWPNGPDASSLAAMRLYEDWMAGAVA